MRIVADFTQLPWNVWSHKNRKSNSKWGKHKICVSERRHYVKFTKRKPQKNGKTRGARRNRESPIITEIRDFGRCIICEGFVWFANVSLILSNWSLKLRHGNVHRFVNGTFATLNVGQDIGRMWGFTCHVTKFASDMYILILSLDFVKYVYRKLKTGLLPPQGSFPGIWCCIVPMHFTTG